MNIVCVVNDPAGDGKVAPVRLCEFARPTHAANLPLAHDPDARVGRFEDMDAAEAAGLLKAMDEAFA